MIQKEDLVHLLRLNPDLSTHEIAERFKIDDAECRSDLNGLWESQVVGRRKLNGVERWSLTSVLELAVEHPATVKVAPAIPKFYMIRELFDMYRAGKLNLQPFFQRNIVWKVDAQADLIDSIMRGYPIPEVFLHLNNETGVYEVMDGQQRLTSIVKFIMNQVIVAGFGKYTGLNRDQKKFFDEYPVTVREVADLPDTMIREIFRRLNTNIMPLVAQELRHAIYKGRFIKMIDQLAKDEYWTYNRIISRTEAQRMRTSELISELIIGMKEGVQNGRYQLSYYYDEYQETFTENVTELWKGRFVKVMEVLREVLGDIRYSYWRRKPNFYAIFMTVWLLYTEKKRIRRQSYTDVSGRLKEFMYGVKTSDRQPSNDPIVTAYYEVGLKGGWDHLEHRHARIKLLHQLISPYTESI